MGKNSHNICSIIYLFLTDRSPNRSEFMKKAPSTDDFRIYLANELSRDESLAFFSRSILQTSFPAGNPWHFFRNQFCKRAFQGGIHGFFQ
jgi:hypothetical protein